MFVTEIDVGQGREPSVQLECYFELTGVTDIDFFKINCEFLKEFTHFVGLFLCLCPFVIGEKGHLPMRKFIVKVLPNVLLSRIFAKLF